MKKRKVPSWVWLIVVVAGFSAIAASMIANFNATFAVAYGFGILAILTGAYSLRLTVKNGNDAKSQFYGFPILRVGAIYFVVQIVASIACMALADWVSVAIAVIAFVVLFVLAALGLGATSATRDEINRQDAELKKNVSKMRSLQSLSNSLISQCEDAEIRQEVQKLADALRYSDPVSSNALENVEKELTICINELQRAILENDKSGAIGLCKRAVAILAERNRLCKLNK